MRSRKLFQISEARLNVGEFSGCDVPKSGDCFINFGFNFFETFCVGFGFSGELVCILA